MWCGAGRARAVASGLLALALIVCVGSPAWATIVRYLPLERLIGISDVIVTARVRGARTFWDAGERKIMTATTLEVERGWLGAPGAQVVVQQIGGTLDGRTTRIPGDVRFAADERAVLFLKGPFKGERGEFYTFSALAQSRYTIAGEGAGAVVRRELGELAFMAADGETVRAIEEPPRGLEAFSAELEALIAGLRGGR